MKIKQGIFFLLALFTTFFLDEQLTFFFSGFTGFRVTLASHLLLLVIFYGSFEFGSVLTYALLFLTGLFYDSHYVLTLGLVSLLLPLFFFLLRLSGNVLTKGWWQRLFAFLCLLICFEVLLYGLARLVGLTSYPFRNFLTAQLLPTILINLAYMLGFSRAVERVLGLRQITNEL